MLFIVLIVFVSPPPLPLHLFVTQIFFHGACCCCQSCTHFAKKKTRGAFGRNAKKKNHESTTVLNKQKRTICVFKCWLICQLAPFEALRSLAKTSTIQRHGPFFASCRTKNNIRQTCLFSYIYPYHIGRTCPVKAFSWSRNGAFWGRMEGRDAHPQSTEFNHKKCAEVPFTSSSTPKANLVSENE